MTEAKSSIEILEQIDTSLNELSILCASINRAAMNLMDSVPAGEDWKVTAIKSMATDGNRLAERSLDQRHRVREVLNDGGSPAEPVSLKRVRPTA